MTVKHPLKALFHGLLLAPLVVVPTPVKIIIDPGSHGIRITNLDTSKVPFMHFHADGTVEIDGTNTPSAQR